MPAARAMPERTRRPKPWRDPRWRGLAAQATLLAVVGALGGLAFFAARENMRARGIPTDFGFWSQPASFEVSQSLIAYSSSSSYGRAFFVGLLNTLLVAALGVVLATVIGFVVGVGRLSSNWLVAKASRAYVEALRNLPLLLQLLFWYNAVLKALPGPRQSLQAGQIFLNNRGLFAPEPLTGPGAAAGLAALAAGLAAAVLWVFLARARQARTGRRPPVALVAMALIVAPPVLAALVFGAPAHFRPAQLKGFNFVGGLRLTPEFVALVLGLSTYTASFIAEIVRAGLLAVPKGQREAGEALGLTQGQILRLIVAPQAMRVIAPPLTSQYLNLTKNSSLAVFISYPDLVQVFMGTVLNQTGAAVPIVALTMAVYLAISLAVSAVMNAYNRRLARHGG